jgi:hypothetical protein
MLHNDQPDGSIGFTALWRRLEFLFILRHKMRILLRAVVILEGEILFLFT